MIEATVFSQFMDSKRELASETLADGSRKLVVGVVSGPSYRVDHVRGERRVTILSTAHADEARAVYEAFDGRDRGWHPAYPPRGGLPPARETLGACVHAAGSSVEDCVRGFLDGRGEALQPGSLQPTGEDLGCEFQWSVTFASEGSGTGFRAAGRRVPGGYVMTWWA